MKTHEKLLLENRAWAALQLERDPEFFNRLEHVQTPEFLWIGCSDSRVPANEITNTQPGEIFVHRNIANIVDHTDLNMMSVVQYAVEVLQVKHIIVCGHYGCGGVKAAMGNSSFGLIDNWLRNIKDTYYNNRVELDNLKDASTRADRLTELNVIHGVYNLVKTNIIQRAWKDWNKPVLHGWVYRLSDGILHDLCKVEPGSEIERVYRFD
ncbi:MAG: carbonate dehydratase [Cyclobacteriaceae bacterium]|jgi:carbonic anhydrase